MIKESIGIEIKRLRNKSELSQEALADLSGVAISFLKQIELGQKQPSVTTLFKLANALNTTPDTVIMPCWKRWKSRNRNSF